MPYESSEVIYTEEAQQTSHLPGIVAKWISLAQALNGTKPNLSDEGHIFLMCNWSGLGGLALDRHGDVRGALGFGSEYCRRFSLLPTSTAYLGYHSISRGLKTAHSSINLSDFLQVWGNPVHIARYYPNSQFSCRPWSSCMCRKANSCSCAGWRAPWSCWEPKMTPRPVPSAPSSSSTPHMATFSCLSPSVLSSCWPTHPTPATFCQPYSSQWSIITFLCSHWWLLEGAALCRCSNWDHNLCSNECLCRVHHGKWGSVNPKSLQKLTGKGWLAGVI